MIGILRWRSSDAQSFIMPNDVARGWFSRVRHSWQHKEAEAGSAQAGEHRFCHLKAHPQHVSTLLPVAELGIKEGRHIKLPHAVEK